jgi:hypothetical protein
MPGAHPKPCVHVKKARRQVTPGTPNDPAFPARWFSAYLVLPAVPGFLATVVARVGARAGKTRRRLTPSSLYGKRPPPRPDQRVAHVRAKAACV